MRFAHLPVHSPLDVTQNFEQLQKLVTEQEEKVKALEAGAWTNPESFSAKLEETTTCQVRKEGASARLKGSVKAKEEVPAGTALFTLPFHPAALAHVPAVDITIAGGAVQEMFVNTSGVVESSLKITAAHVIAFDAITYHLT